MKYDLIRLNNNIDKYVKIDEVYTFSKDQLTGTDLIKLDDVKITGEIFKNALGNLEISCDVYGTMVLPCAITLKPVDYPFEIKINGQIDELMENNEENYANFKNTIDILPIIWENILMEIPTRVVSKDVNPSDYNISGNGWKFVTDEQTNNNPLSELLDIVNDSEVK